MMDEIGSAIGVLLPEAYQGYVRRADDFRGGGG